MTVGTLAAILDAAPDPMEVSVLPPVSRQVAVSISAPASLAPPLPPAPAEGAHHVAAHLASPAVADAQRHRRRWPWVALVFVVAVAAVVVVQLRRPVPAVAMHRSLPAVTPVVGATPVLPWPATGEAAVAVPQLGVTVQSGAEAAVPIASLTKIMTAYLTLREHPLAPKAQGPLLTMTAADQADASADEAAGATNVAVQPGEKLTERQLLNGLLVHSANNLADVLAKWDAGTIPAFVAKMNATATALGMTHTHYADASGLNPGTQGSAADELIVTRAAMAIPTFAAVVDQRQVTLPGAGVLLNYVSSVGTQGIVGVKSGFTQKAMGCLVLAAQRTVAGHRVLVLAAVTGQPGDNPLDAANGVDERLLDAVVAGIREVPVSARGAAVGSVTLPWAQRPVPVVAAAPIALLAWPGQVPHLSFTSKPVYAGMSAGTQMGTLSASIGAERLTVPVQVADSLVGPTLSWRLQRS
jgi:D-alanyl-D-alanine carboxypeptidase (penicillin-binding protein 5/6)